MIVKGIVKKGEYFDSVSLMMISSRIKNEEEDIEISIVIGSQENIRILKEVSLYIDKFATSSDNDLLVVVRGANENKLDQVIDKVNKYLKESQEKEDSFDSNYLPKSMEGALEQLPKANLVLISLAGKYAVKEAFKALENDLNIMLFSDNISYQDELSLKQMANKKGLLVMGPDCGTSIINGIPLAFANNVRKGDIGIVAASGTGAQEVSSIISNFGGGISQLIGTGGRDLKSEIGGITFLDSLKFLSDDPHTKKILLISKPPDKEVLNKIITLINSISTPVYAVFLGLAEHDEINLALNLEEGAYKVMGLPYSIKEVESKLLIQAKLLKQRIKSNSFLIKGLFSGGTYKIETEEILKSYLGDGYQKHSLIDFGDDEYTQGRPHPMIDYSLRKKNIFECSEKEEVAIILLDIVLGYGAHPNPLTEILPTLKEVALEKIVIVSVTGTDQDPQNRSEVINGLQEAGVEVMDSMSQAAILSALIIKELED